MMGDMDKMKSIPDDEIQKVASQIPPEALDVLKRSGWRMNMACPLIPRVAFEREPAEAIYRVFSVNEVVPRTP